MGNTFEKINYNLRPAKAVERKMISASLQKLNRICPISDYQYVGFGSTFFKDHIIFHKELGIQELLSIEKSGKEARFDFNKPFHCIDINFGHSTDVLPKIKWIKRTILWLDYEGTVKTDFFSDIGTFFRLAKTGSVFIMTLNIKPDSYGQENAERRERLIRKIGEEKIPVDAKKIDFSTNNLANTIKRILDNEIRSILSQRNGVLTEGEKLEYNQLFNFHYSDGAPMMTLGGIITNPEDKENFDKANFYELGFLRKENDPFKIEVPALTNKEIKFLDSQLPCGINEAGQFLDETLQNPEIPVDDIVNYSKIYSFFPHYLESLHI